MLHEAFHPPAAPLLARMVDHQRHVSHLRADPRLALVQLPLLAHHRPVIGHEDDDRVLHQTQPLHVA